ncbi:glycosyltransferase family 15 protein [Gymnopus androsaceus JB14]|uniref:Glycosyltransferase family 15 protein n=1 Tax=Gymnopus androsaceus JB14 TaxID=1447944 RepID=A0A6A4I4D1_9AGAR|nr:glycosyltransferase family 15 protein [Gymnopus androsaceus JB14]
MFFSAFSLNSQIHWQLITLYISATFSGGLGQLVFSPRASNKDFTFQPSYRNENATLVFLARNSDIDGVVSSMREVERSFNEKYHYPWVFLNDEEFTNEFRGRVLVETRSSVKFGLIPREHWVQPDWIDEAKAAAARARMKKEKVIYGGSLQYRNMCRFYSGFFFKHPLLQQYKYYWRIEPDVKYSCDTNYDPFHFMINNNHTYSFTIALYEIPETIPTLWDSVKKFIEKYPQYIVNDNAMEFISADGGETYTSCHFWSNFEIADMDFWRSEAYQKFFNFLDTEGGFYYERWGDAPVHSIAAALFLPKHNIHFFRDIGYRHATYEHCPSGNEYREGSCSCRVWNRIVIDYRGQSCLPKYEKISESIKQGGG